MRLVNAETLAAALHAAWPTHIEGSGGFPDVPTSNWRVYDPAYPSDALAEAILAAIPPVMMENTWGKPVEAHDADDCDTCGGSGFYGLPYGCVDDCEDEANCECDCHAAIPPDPRLDALLAAIRAIPVGQDGLNNEIDDGESYGPLCDALAAFEDA